MKSCKDIQAQLADYVVGALTDAQRAEIERHIRDCAACARERLALERTGALLNALRPQETPAQLWDAVRNVIESEQRRPWLERLREAFAFPRPAYVAGAAVLALAAGLYLMVLRPPPPAGAETDNYIEQHGLMAWNDPLSDKAALGVMLAQAAAPQETP
ncbi:MAG: zf-HC2 domain-containing protein [Verrucomicrobiae bacterium]|nr:zf-HC2 domain-containing protein [Verrucomicrobiae bacterium]